MMVGRVTHKRPCLSAVLLLSCALSCGGEAPADATSQSTTASVYVVRGEVVGLPDPAYPTVGFYVRHEAIDDFRAADGTIAGMNAMTMQFPLTDPSLLQGVNVGDKVELTYLVDWHGEPMQDVTALRKLAPDTELEFRDADPTN
jgi:Cu/Ag efflux protein CusF